MRAGSFTLPRICLGIGMNTIAIGAGAAVDLISSLLFQ